MTSGVYPRSSCAAACGHSVAPTAGNVMMTFALATIPMIGFVGAAVDYSRGNSAKAAMQSAIDATGADAVEGSAERLSQAEIKRRPTSSS